MRSYTFPTLFRHGKAESRWSISVREISAGSASIVTTYCRVGGKNRTETLIVSTPGAYFGALKQAKSKWDAKLFRDRYSYDQSGVNLGAALIKQPMRAYGYSDHSSRVDWSGDVFVQPKLDGHRCLAKLVNGKPALYSMNGNRIELPHIKKALVGLLPDDAILDGEIYSHGKTLGEIGSLIRRPQQNTSCLEFFVYDCVMSRRFSDRWDFCQKVVDSRPGVRLTTTVKITSEAEALAQHRIFESQGYEGAMLRHGEFPYVHDRFYSLLKIKSFRDAEFEIIGYREGRGRYSGMPVFFFKTEAGEQFEALAPGNFEEKRKAWQNREQYVGKWMTIKYKTFERVPVPAVALRLREDI